MLPFQERPWENVNPSEALQRLARHLEDLETKFDRLTGRQIAVGSFRSLRFHDSRHDGKSPGR